jgi:LSD1 subclass zinc finger protein
MFGVIIGMSYLTNVQARKWEPDARSEPLPRTEPEPRTEPTPRTEPAARTEPEGNEILSIKCPSCGYLLIYSKGTKKQTIRCTKCGNVFQVE